MRMLIQNWIRIHQNTCLLYTSDAADERSSVDLGGRRIIKQKTKTKKKKNTSVCRQTAHTNATMLLGYTD